MTLRGDDKPVADEKGNTPTHVRNKAGRIFIATPQLIDRDDMSPIFDGDEEEIKNSNSNLDLLAERGPPSHVRAQNGRVFVATAELIDRGDMEFLYDYKPGVVTSKAATNFVLSKANKQAIKDKGIEDFDVEISMDQGLVEMRSDYKALTEGKSIGVDEVFEKDKIAFQALEEFGIVLDVEGDLDSVQKSMAMLQDADEDFLNNIREKQKNDQEDNQNKDNDTDDSGNDSDEDSDTDDEDSSKGDGSDSNPDNKE